MAATRRLPIVGGHEGGLAATARTDAWWAAPIATFLGFSAFIAYANWALFQAKHYFADPYLSPFYSPVLFTDSDMPGHAPLRHALFGEWNDAWWPDFIPFSFSPAMLILVFPLSFRFTCYYYRKSYYRAFVGSPPACAVQPLTVRLPYHGETTYLLIQNLHRYALYAAIAFLFILSYDAVLAYWRDGRFGVGVGSIMLTLNPVFLGMYTLGCHSFRHLIGGGTDCMSCGEETLKYKSWKRVSWLNARHGIFAWISLVWVALCDVYVRLVSMGIIRDLNTWDL